MQNILVVVDMQNDFIDGALGTKEAAAIVPGVQQKIRDFQGKVFFTRDTHETDYMSTQEGQKLPVPHCIKGTDGWQIHPDLQPLCQGTLIDKVTFGSSELAALLQAEDQKEPVDSITFIGLCTDICVISNALLVKAFLPEAKIIVDASCCAGVTPESHRNALEAMKVCQIQIEESCC
ncbi:MAG: cysteine hydrolase [Lachnospiraceae bacterium]|nr:cysteine hydrolase [Lachnospiraceae bacterium]